MAHTFKEAFCLMKYRDTAGNIEWVWNSRDGITPFTIRSPAGLMSQHVEWKRDTYAPHHAPREGDRIFVNLTLERALEYRRAFVAKHWDEGEYAMKLHPVFESMTQEQAAEHLAKLDVAEYGGEAPDVITVTAEMATEYAKHGVDRHPERRPRE